MPKATVIEEGDYRHEEGWVEIQLQSVVERSVDYVLAAKHKAVQDGTGRVGDKASFLQWRWAFTVAEGPYKGDSFNVDTDPKVSSREGNIARVLAETFLGRGLEVGEGVDTDLFEGSKIQGFITQSPASKKKDGTLGYYTNLTDFAQLGGGQKPQSKFEDEPPF